MVTYVEGQKQSTSTTDEQLAEETDCEKQLSTVHSP